MSVEQGRVHSFGPVLAPSYTTTSDARVKRNTEDMDTDQLLLSMQDVELKQYLYTKDWARSLRPRPDEPGLRSPVRGVIAQQLADSGVGGDVSVFAGTSTAAAAAGHVKLSSGGAASGTSGSTAAAGR